METLEIEELKNYYKARDIFNNKYKNKYQVRIFLDLTFLNFYIDNLKENTHIHLQVLNNHIAKLDVDTIIKAFEELKEGKQ